MAVFDPFAVPISRSRPAAISAATVRSCAIFALSLAGAIVFACWLHRSYPLGDWLFFDVAKIWLFELVLSAACVTAGYAIVDRCLPAEPRDELEALVLAFPVGLVAFVMGMFAGGLLRTYGPVFALALPAVLISGGVPAGVAALRRLRGRPSGLSGANQGLLSRAMVAAGILGVGLLYLGVMSPAALNHDAAWNHLVVAQDYAREGRMVRFPGDWVKNLPHLGSVVNTWAFLVPGLREPQLRWMMALHSEFVVFLWTLAGISVLGRWLVGRRGSKAWVAFLLFPAIFIYDNNMGGAADHFVALFAAPLLLLTAKAAERFARGPCLLWGLLAGGALLSKLQAVYLLGPLAAVIAVRVVILLTRRRRWWNRGDGPAPAGGLLLMAITATAVLAPHLLLNTLWFHNPVYPLWQDLFTGSRPTVTDAPMLVDTLFAAWP
ncbi:MAG TPA: hypothetical protein VFH73_04800, partial [Polyangia bacterium]|nr:hypothetical protein [Polyangia bacterium]